MRTERSIGNAPCILSWPELSPTQAGSLRHEAYGVIGLSEIIWAGVGNFDESHPPPSAIMS